MPFFINKKSFLVAVFFAALPFFATAQAAGPVTTSYNPSIVIATLITNLKGILWTIATAYVLFMFVIAGFKFLTAHGDTTKVADARKMVIYGVVGTTVIILAWSAVIIMKGLLGV